MLKWKVNILKRTKRRKIVQEKYPGETIQIKNVSLIIGKQTYIKKVNHVSFLTWHEKEQYL